jgi:hypothetical protein
MALAVTMSNEYWEAERVVAKPQPLTYSTATLENIGKQFADVVLPDARVRATNTSLMIRVADSSPRSGIGGDLNTLKSYVEGDLADSLHADINVNISNVKNKMLNATIADNFNYSNHNDSVYFIPLINNTNTDATHYSINFTIDDYRNTVDDFSYTPAGDIRVTMLYTDKNGTIQTFGNVSSTAPNSFSITYGVNETKKIEITLGEVAIQDNQYDGALLMNMTNASVDFAFEVNLSQQSTNSSNLIVFPIPINYSQGGIFKEMNASR